MLQILFRSYLHVIEMGTRSAILWLKLMPFYELLLKVETFFVIFSRIRNILKERPAKIS